MLKLSQIAGHDGNAGIAKQAVFTRFSALSADGKTDAATNYDGYENFDGMHYLLLWRTSEMLNLESGLLERLGKHRSRLVEMKPSEEPKGMDVSRPDFFFSSALTSISLQPKAT